MERFQFITKVKCPSHANFMYVVVKVLEDGSVDYWKGCRECDGHFRLFEGNPKTESSDK